MISPKNFVDSLFEDVASMFDKKLRTRVLDELIETFSHHEDPEDQKTILSPKMERQLRSCSDAEFLQYVVDFDDVGDTLLQLKLDDLLSFIKQAHAISSSQSEKLIGYLDNAYDWHYDGDTEVAERIAAVKKLGLNSR
jgi:hypothetical protein